MDPMDEAEASVDLDGTTCWYCECGEVLNSRTAKTHECEAGDDGAPQGESDEPTD